MNPRERLMKSFVEKKILLRINMSRYISNIRDYDLTNLPVNLIDLVNSLNLPVNLIGLVNSLNLPVNLIGLVN